MDTLSAGCQHESATDIGSVADPAGFTPAPARVTAANRP
jgi:hypothetical protein